MQRKEKQSQLIKKNKVLSGNGGRAEQFCGFEPWYPIVNYTFSKYILHNKPNISINQIDYNLVIYVFRDSLTDLQKQEKISQNVTYYCDTLVIIKIFQ